MPTISSSFREALEPVLLAMADDELVIGHRHSEWTGWAPHIEEDIAFSSIAQDEIGHANLFFTLLSEISEKSPDELALARAPEEYLHAVLCERPNRDWAYTLARHFLYDSADRFRLESLQGSAYTPLSDVCEKLLREERYHQLHADAWFRRVSTGPVEGRHQFSIALSDALPESVGLFEETEQEPQALDLGILKIPSKELMQEWLTEVVGRIESAGIALDLQTEDDPDLIATSTGEMIEESHRITPRPSIARTNGYWELRGTFPGTGGRRGIHTDDFRDLWDDLTKTYREEPTATW